MCITQTYSWHIGLIVIRSWLRTKNGTDGFSKAVTQKQDLINYILNW